MHPLRRRKKNAGKYLIKYLPAFGQQKFMVNALKESGGHLTGKSTPLGNSQAKLNTYGSKLWSSDPSDSVMRSV